MYDHLTLNLNKIIRKNILNLTSFQKILDKALWDVQNIWFPIKRQLQGAGVLLGGTRLWHTTREDFKQMKDHLKQNSVHNISSEKTLQWFNLTMEWKTLSNIIDGAFI